MSLAEVKGRGEKYRLAGGEKGITGFFVRETIATVIIMNWFLLQTGRLEKRETWEYAGRSVMAMDFASL